MAEREYQYGRTNAESIRTLLEIWPVFQNEFHEALEILLEDESDIVNSQSINFSWCHLYEISFKEHVETLLKDHLCDETLSGIIKNLGTAQDQVSYLPNALEQINEYIDSWDSPTEEEKISLVPLMAEMFIARMTIFYSLNSVLYYGRFINDLIKDARQGSDKSLFNAIKIDPTILGCPTAIRRINQAIMLKDQKFFKSLKASISGKFGSLEQANFQKMRLVIQVLWEAGAVKLSDDQLKHLFVDTLNLYSWNEVGGGNTKALRKFVEQYMRKNTTTQNRHF